MIARTLFQPTIQEQFETDLVERPEVLAELVRLARQWRAMHPTRKCGIGMLWEAMRWQFALTYDGEWKLNNSLRSRYARFIMAEYPDLEGVFEVRKLVAA